MAVAAAGSPNMTVVVGNGSAVISTGTYPSSYGYLCANDTSGGESVTITTASSSNPRIDAIVAYINKGATITSSPANNPGLLVYAAVAGTPASSPVAPTNSAIQSAIGASNPYVVLANVLVGTSVSQINNGNITDLRKYAAVSTVNSTSPYKFSAYATSATNLAASFAPTKVALQAKTYDTSSNFDSTTNYRFTAPISANYTFYGIVGIFLQNNVQYQSYLYKNGTALKNGLMAGNAVGGNAHVASSVMALNVPLVAGDYIELWAAQNAGSVAATDTGASITYLEGYLAGV